MSNPGCVTRSPQCHQHFNRRMSTPCTQTLQPSANASLFVRSITAQGAYGRKGLLACVAHTARLQYSPSSADPPHVQAITSLEAYQPPLRASMCHAQMQATEMTPTA